MVRLMLAVETASGRSSGLPNTCRTPAPSCRPNPPAARREGAPGAPAGIRRRIAAESAKVTASTTIATGAVSACTTSPPSPRPAICRVAPVLISNEFAATRRSRPTSSGR